MSNIITAITADGHSKIPPIRILLGFVSATIKQKSVDIGTMIFCEIQDITSYNIMYVFN